MLAQPRYPGIALVLEMARMKLTGREGICVEMREALPGVGIHRAEFDEAKYPRHQIVDIRLESAGRRLEVFAPDKLGASFALRTACAELPEQNRTSRIEPDHDRLDDHEWQRKRSRLLPPRAFRIRHRPPRPKNCRVRARNRPPECRKPGAVLPHCPMERPPTVFRARATAAARRGTAGASSLTPSDARGEFIARNPYISAVPAGRRRPEEMRWPRFECKTGQGASCRRKWSEDPSNHRYSIS